MGTYAVVLVVIGAIVLAGGLLLIASAIRSAVGGVPFVRLEDDVAQLMIASLSPQPGEVLYDLGCGDARHLISACRQNPTIQGRGVEVAYYPMLRAVINHRLSHLGERLRLQRADIYSSDLSGANMIFMYLSPPALERIQHKLSKELSPGSRVASARYPLPNWQPEKTITSAKHPIFLYKV